MEVALRNEVSELVSYGWEIKSQSDSTVSMETRKPFNIWIFLLLFLLFLGFGALIYLLYWLLFSRAYVFLHVENGTVEYSGDSELVAQQRAMAEQQRRKAKEIKEKGFWRVMWPSVLAMVLVIAIWVAVIWAMIRYWT